MDVPEPGHSIPSSIGAKVQASDGVLCLWTTEAKNSFWVNFEMYVSRRFAKPMCLIRHVSQKLTGSYDLRYAVTLCGIAFRSDDIPWTDEKQATGPHEFKGKFLKECLIFADRVRDHKADIHFSIPSPPGHGFRHEPNAVDRRQIEVELEASVNAGLNIPDATNDYPKSEECFQ
jgi:hypothetical protein